MPCYHVKRHTKRQAAVMSPALLLTHLGVSLSGLRSADALKVVPTEPLTTAHGPNRSAAPAQCAWSVHYGARIPGFDKVPYPHHARGEHCLEACCQDPGCKGLAIEAEERWSCFRYQQSPSEGVLAKYPAQPLDDGLWLVERQQAWSVLVKEDVGPSSMPHPVHPSLLHALSWSGGRTIQSHDAVARRTSVPKPPHHTDHCQWEVHYDVWEPSYDRGEYRQAFKFAGGAHCLEACCRDTKCTGIQMMSSELYECYKYSKAPDLHGRSGSPLGDSRWLLQKAPAWSVFMKVGILPAPDQSTMLREVSLDQHLRFAMAKGIRASAVDKHAANAFNTSHQEAAVPSAATADGERSELSVLPQMPPQPHSTVDASSGELFTYEQQEVPQDMGEGADYKYFVRFAMAGFLVACLAQRSRTGERGLLKQQRDLHGTQVLGDSRRL